MVHVTVHIEGFNCIGIIANFWNANQRINLSPAPLPALLVGRVRADPLFHLKFVVCSHNTIRGAAGGSIYNAELLVKEGLMLRTTRQDTGWK
jgi:hypothetical protein